LPFLLSLVLYPAEALPSIKTSNRKPFMIILVLDAFHADSSEALVRDGVLIAAAEEERFKRTKHRVGFPSEGMAYCLAQAGVGLEQVDHIAVNEDGR
jgi:carbamoyltransferase